MSEVSARLNLPILQPAQAQKHVTHNEALQRLDALVQMVLEATKATTPPPLAQPGEVWALGANPTGAWAGQPGQLAQWVDPGWVFIEPQTGWRGWDRTAATLKVFDGTDWEASGGTQNLPGIGVNAAWDTTNRLSVASEATLLNHDGAGHQLKLNKATAGDTASLLYQTNFTGHAEMGLTGDNDFSVKVSPDGSTWTEALVVDATSGTLSGAAIQGDATDTGAGKLALAEYTYGISNVVGAVSQLAGQPTGAVIERGANSNGSYMRLADGTQIVWAVKNAGPGNAEGSGTFDNPWSVALQAVDFPIAFSAPPAITFGFSVQSSNTMARSIVARYAEVKNDRIVAFRTARFGSAADNTDVRMNYIAIGRWF